MRGEAIGIDVGGTKVEAILFSNNKVKGRLREPTAKSQSALFDQLTRLANTLSQTAPVGISFPGYLYEGVLHDCPNLPFLEGKPVLQLLRRKLLRAVAFENDANCFAIAEYVLGGHEARTLVGLVIGTGIGCGLILDGALYKGAHNAAGEIGSLPYAETNIEAYAAGPGILKRFYTHGGEKSAAETIFTAKSAAAKTTVKETTQAIQWLITFLQQTYDPDLIVLGGGVSNAPILKQLKGPVQKNTLGDDAGVIGAALLALKAHNNKV